MIDRMLKGTKVERAWLVHTGATRAERMRYVGKGAKLIMLDEPAHICKRRVQERGNNELWWPLIDKWWAKYED